MEKEKTIQDEIILSDGKYMFYKDDHTLFCDRYGEAWRSFLGDNAVTILFDECMRLKKAVLQLEELVGKIVSESR